MRRFLIPETVQTSAMDCGPASLKSLLEGFGVSASYGRLREACQTDIDGTSIDTIEDAAVQLGLDATQVMLPLDHLLEAGAGSLPAVVVVMQPNGAHHFVVVWRRHGRWVQVMDPAIGRRWVTVQRFLAEVYEHSMPVPAGDWREWADSDSFQRVLHTRLRRLRAPAAEMIRTAAGDPTPAGLARLDAAARMTERLAASGAIRRGRESSNLVRALATGAKDIPREYWSAHPESASSGSVTLRGAVLIQVKGRLRANRDEPISAELEAALREPPSRPGWELIRILFEDGWRPAALTCLAIAAAAAGAIVQAILLRGLCDLARELTDTGQRSAALAAALTFIALLAGLEFLIATLILRTGRRLDLRLRLRFLYKVPRLADRYFRSRPSSDMAQRSHNVHQLRQAPELAATFARCAMEIVFTVMAIGWFYPAALLPSMLVAAAAVGIPLLVQPALTERDLKLRSHSGALLQFNLDALLGLVAIRAHGASAAVRREQTALLAEWARTGLNLQRTVTWAEGMQMGAALALAAWVVWAGLAATTDVAGALLLVYWVLNIPVLGQEAAGVVWRYPMLRNTALRFAEPLGAPQETVSEAAGGSEAPVAVSLSDVTVVAGGHTILSGVTVHIGAGTHVGIVGRSGAGKSSLVGLLLGWHTPSAGSVEIDGRVLDSVLLDELRRSTAWVDPQVQIWNRSFYANLTYGGSGAVGLDTVLDDAGLTGVVSKLPEGMSTGLGEGGGLVSGGEGQRVRFGRAMARGAARLVILDEPARGLDRRQRAALVERARRRWRGSTLLCITHDVSDTLSFDRVLVVEDGRIIEDGNPAVLARTPDSRYAGLLETEETVRRTLWSGPEWRRMRLQSATLEPGPREDRRAAV